MASWSGRDREQLLEELKAGFLRLKGSVSPIRDGQPHLVPFCETLENVLRVGLKQPGSILRVTRRDYWDWIEVLPTNSVCSTKKNPLLTEAVETVKRSDVLRTPQGRGRCFLRMALMQKLVPIPVEHLLKNPKLLAYWYQKSSIIRHEELAGQLVNILFEVTELDFDLTERASFLDETWIIPEYVNVQLEPCERLGLKLAHMRDRVLVDAVLKGSVAERSQIEAGDIVDELNGVRLFGLKVGQSQQLVSKHSGVINLVIVKSVMCDGMPFAPCQLRQVQVEAIKLLKFKDNGQKSVNQTDSKGAVNGMLQFDVVHLGITTVANPVEDGAIDDAIHSVLEGTGKPEVILLCLERKHLVLTTNDSSAKTLHSFPLSDVAACARGIVHRTCFGFAAGDSCADELTCFVFETPSDTKAKLVVQAMVAAFKRSTWFVPSPVPSPPPGTVTSTDGAAAATATPTAGPQLLIPSTPSRWSFSKVRSADTSPNTVRRQTSSVSLGACAGSAVGLDSPCIAYTRSTSVSNTGDDQRPLGSSQHSISNSSERLCDPVLRRSWNQSFFGEGSPDPSSGEDEGSDSALAAPPSPGAEGGVSPQQSQSATPAAYSDYEVISDADSPLRPEAVVTSGNADVDPFHVAC